MYNDTLAHLAALVAFDTQSHDDRSQDRSNLELIAYAQAHLHDYGYTTIEIQYSETKANLLALPPQITPDSTNLGGLLSGHSDTVPFNAADWRSSPTKLELRDERAYGRGTVDMKGFLACALALAQKSSRTKQYPKIGILITADEESSMAGAQVAGQINSRALSEIEVSKDFCATAMPMQVLVQSPCDLTPKTINQAQEWDRALVNKHFDAIIIGEPSEHKVILAHKGWLTMKIEITGKSCHSSDPKLGINAIELSADLILRIKELSQELERYGAPFPTLNLGTISGGLALNCVCPQVKLGLEIRTTAQFPSERAKMRITQVLEQMRHDYPEARFELSPVYPAIEAFAIEACQFDSSDALALLTQLSEGKTASVNYCTEASFLQQLGPCAIFGPGSIKQAHTVDEYIELSELRKYLTKLEQLSTHFS